jgi:hypothetical protein
MLNGRINIEKWGEAEWQSRTESNNSLDRSASELASHARLVCTGAECAPGQFGRYAATGGRTQKLQSRFPNLGFYT